MNQFLIMQVKNVENIIKDKEADKIVAKIKDDEYVIVLGFTWKRNR